MTGAGEWRCAGCGSKRGRMASGILCGSCQTTNAEWAAAADWIREDEAMREERRQMLRKRLNICAEEVVFWHEVHGAVPDGLCGLPPGHEGRHVVAPGVQFFGGAGYCLPIKRGQGWGGTGFNIRLRGFTVYVRLRASSSSHGEQHRYARFRRITVRSNPNRFDMWGRKGWTRADVQREQRERFQW